MSPFITCIIGSPAIRFLAILLHNVCFILYAFIDVNDVKKGIHIIGLLAKTTRSSLRINWSVRASDFYNIIVLHAVKNFDIMQKPLYLPLFFNNSTFSLWIENHLLGIFDLSTTFPLYIMFVKILCQSRKMIISVNVLITNLYFVNCC